MISLAELFPDEDYRFHLTLRRGELPQFFAPSDTVAAVLAERRQWIAQTPELYVAESLECASLVTAWATLVRSWRSDAAVDCAGLGQQLEPDFLLLSPDGEGEFRLRAGALVFPTSWALTEKLGRTMDEIHGVVPGLNSALGSPIRQFLARLKPGGPSFLRSNWGLAATDALNLHPSRPRPRLSSDTLADQIWLRLEHQILAALPGGAGIVFGIRIALHPLTEVLAQPILRNGFGRALRSMPDDVAYYKGLSEIRPRLLEAI